MNKNLLNYISILLSNYKISSDNIIKLIKKLNEYNLELDINNYLPNNNELYLRLSIPLSILLLIWTMKAVSK